MSCRKVFEVSGKSLLAPWERTCKKCGGRLESKRIRRETRRYRCKSCKSNFRSIPISKEEKETLINKDKGIGSLTLTERYEEIRGLERKKQSYCLLPEYDPKYLEKKTIRSRFRHNHSEVVGYSNWVIETEEKKQFSRQIRTWWKKHLSNK